MPGGGGRPGGGVAGANPHFHQHHGHHHDRGLSGSAGRYSYGYRSQPNFYGTRGTRVYVSPFGYYPYGYAAPGLGIGLGWYAPTYGYLGGLYGSGLTAYYGPTLYDSRFYGTGVYSSGVYRSIPGYPYFGSVPYSDVPVDGRSATLDYSDVPRSDPATSPATDADGYLTAAKSAFRSGDFVQAQRFANHALVDAPELAEAHELMSLAMFAVGDYRQAASAAHVALELAAPADWAKIFRYYNNKDRYTQHLRALEKFVRENGNSPDGRFLLGAHRVMLGHKPEAQQELKAYLQLVGQDPLAEKLFLNAGGKREDLPALADPPPAAAPPTDAPAAVSPADVPAVVPAIESPAADNKPSLPELKLLDPEAKP
jgi:tetratricopeptide (TPR) repeat protein